MRKLIGGLSLATALFFGIGGIAQELPSTVLAQTVQEPHYNAWVYQVTEIDGTGDGVDYYGTNYQYEDFPHVYFTQAEVGELNIKEGDWVVTVFNHDDIERIIKLN